MQYDSFSSFIGDFGNWSWVVLFTQTSFEDTLACYSDIMGQPSSEIIPVSAGRHVNNPSGTVVELLESDWTMILHRLGAWEGFDAAAIAQKLNTRVIAYEAEDTSGSSSCLDIDENGIETRRQDAEAAETDEALYEAMGDYAEEMGEERPTPPPSEMIDNYDDYFKQQGIKLVNLSFNDNFNLAIVDSDQEQHVGRVIRVGNLTE